MGGARGQWKRGKRLFAIASMRRADFSVRSSPRGRSSRPSVRRLPPS